MDQDTTAVQHRDADTDDQLDGELVEELLIEEISIDGMCGVY